MINLTKQELKTIAYCLDEDIEEINGLLKECCEEDRADLEKAKENLSSILKKVSEELANA